MPALWHLMGFGSPRRILQERALFLMVPGESSRRAATPNHALSPWRAGLSILAFKAKHDWSCCEEGTLPV